LSPAQTWASLLSLGPPLLLLAMAASLDLRGRLWLLATIAALAALSVLLGAFQLAGGAAAPRFYAQAHMQGITGFQANRNAASDLLLIAIIAIGALMGSLRRGRSAPGTPW